MAEEKEEKLPFEEILPMVKKVDESINEIKETLEKLKGDINVLKETKDVLDQILYSMKRLEDKLEETYNAIEDYFKKKEEKIVAPEPTPASEPVEPAKPVEEVATEVKKPARIPIPASVISAIFNEFFLALKPTSTPHDVISALNALKDKLARKIGGDHPIFVDIDRWVRRVRAFVAEGKVPGDELEELKAKAENWRDSIH